MCGIAGYVTNQKTDAKHAIAAAVLAVHMEHRGGHSWGVMTEKETFHGLGSVTHGLAVHASMARSFALHTRYGTTGAHTLENSHPFTQKGTAGVIIGMHNGIISNHRELATKYGRQLSVDSQHIFQNIVDGKSLDELTGYGAVCYSLNGIWYLGRFNDGDMHVARTAAGIFFASTKDALFEALTLAGISIEKWLKVKDDTVYTLTGSGLKFAYKVAAAGTRKRWNDGLLLGSTAAAVLPSAPRPKDPERYQVRCDLCSRWDEELFEYEDTRGYKDYLCADCYPLGDEDEGSDAESSYSIAETEWKRYLEEYELLKQSAAAD